MAFLNHRWHFYKLHECIFKIEEVKEIAYKKSQKKQIFYHIKNSLTYAYGYGKKPRAYTFELP